MLRHVALLPLLFAAVAACSDDATPTPGAPSPEPLKENQKLGEIRSSETWKDGTEIVGKVSIFEGATVTIAPGAKITCNEAATIQVGGTLKVDSEAKHATITCAKWIGVIAFANGTLDLDGLDIENAERAIETTENAKPAIYANGTIKNSARPFTVRAKSSLTVTKATVTTPDKNATGATSVSEIFGTFTAKFLEYDANRHEGIMTMKGGVTDIEDSKLFGTGALDLVSSYGGKSLKVRYTTLVGGHCGPHIAQSKDATGRLEEPGTPTESFEFDHVTSETNTYGITIYSASATGPHIVKDSNFIGTVAWLDLQGDHGPITFTNVFTQGNDLIVPTAQSPAPVIGKVGARIAAAVPRQ